MGKFKEKFGFVLAVFAIRIKTIMHEQANLLGKFHNHGSVKLHSTSP